MFINNVGNFVRVSSCNFTDNWANEDWSLGGGLSFKYIGRDTNVPLNCSNLYDAILKDIIVGADNNDDDENEKLLEKMSTYVCCDRARIIIENSLFSNNSALYGSAIFFDQDVLTSVPGDFTRFFEEYDKKMYQINLKYADTLDDAEKTASALEYILGAGGNASTIDSKSSDEMSFGELFELSLRDLPPPLIRIMNCVFINNRASISGTIFQYVEAMGRSYDNAEGPVSRFTRAIYKYLVRPGKRLFFFFFSFF